MRTIVSNEVRVNDVVIGTRWKHKKRGSEYTIIAIARGQCSNKSTYMYLGIEDQDFVVYQDERGEVWTRHIDEFLDGRFEQL